MVMHQIIHSKKLITREKNKYILLTEVAFICICLDMFLGGIVNNPTLVMADDKMSILTLMDLPAPLNAVACEELLAWLKTLLGLNVSAFQ